jgi:hypothetical protein
MDAGHRRPRGSQGMGSVCVTSLCSCALLTMCRARCTSAVPFLFPVALLHGEGYYDGGLAYNNPTLLAIEEAKSFWGPDDTRTLVLSIGCGTARKQHNARNGPLSCCTHSFFESMSAAKQNSDLLLRGYRFTRLDPSLDIDVVALDDFEAISRLQQSFSTMLSHDIAFAELLHSAAFQLLSSLFYLEIVPQLVPRPLSPELCVVGMIRPRLPSSSLQHLHRHETFPSLYFLVNGRPVTFSMPKKVSVRVTDLNESIEILLCNQSQRARISGSPMSIVNLCEAQENFYCRFGSRKRRVVRKSFD